jgi:hypothetical protein
MSNLRKIRRGTSLVEILVASALLGLLFYNIYRLLVPGMQVWMKSDKKVTLQQNALLGMYRLKDEIKETNQNTITLREYDINTDKIDTLICFASAVDNNGVLKNKTVTNLDGTKVEAPEPEWQKFVIFYRDNQNKIRRHEKYTYETAREPGSMRIAGDPKNEIDLIGDRIVAARIKTLEILYNSPPPEWNGGLNIKITAFDDDIDFTTTLETTVGARYNEIQ